MLHLPGAVGSGHWISWTIIFPETSSRGDWDLAGIARGGLRGQGRSPVTVCRVLVVLAASLSGSALSALAGIALCSA